MLLRNIPFQAPGKLDVIQEMLVYGAYAQGSCLNGAQIALWSYIGWWKTPIWGGGHWCTQTWGRSIPQKLEPLSSRKHIVMGVWWCQSMRIVNWCRTCDEIWREDVFFLNAELGFSAAKVRGRRDTCDVEAKGCLSLGRINGESYGARKGGVCARGPELRDYSVHPVK